MGSRRVGACGDPAGVLSRSSSGECRFMKDEQPNDLIALHVTGPDRPGITSALTTVFAEEGARLVDLGQSVLHGHLTLTAVIAIPRGSDCLRRALFRAGELGMRLEVATHQLPAPGEHNGLPCSVCVTLLGDLEDGTALAWTTAFLAQAA